ESWSVVSRVVLFSRALDAGVWLRVSLYIFFFNDTATTEIYTLSLHDALPILCYINKLALPHSTLLGHIYTCRSEEHTSELQSHLNLVCRLLLEKKQASRCRARGRERVSCTMLLHTRTHEI